MLGKHFNLQCDLHPDTKETSHLLLRVQIQPTSFVPTIPLSSIPPLTIGGRKFTTFLHLTDVRPYRFVSEYEAALVRFGRSIDDLYFFPLGGGVGDYLVFCADASTCKYLFYSTACHHLCSSQRPSLSTLQPFEPKKKKKVQVTKKTIKSSDNVSILVTNSYAHLLTSNRKA